MMTRWKIAAVGCVPFLLLCCGCGEDGDAVDSESGGTGSADGDDVLEGIDLEVQCDLETDCVLVHASCCGYDCGEPSLSDFVAVRADSYADLKEALCEGQDPEYCPNCPGYEQENFVSVCRDGACQAVDVREDILSRCDTPSDCRLRWGGDCCEMCHPDIDAYMGEYLIAISTLENWADQVCEDVPGCPPCEDLAYPDGAGVDCVEGQCLVIDG